MHSKENYILFGIKLVHKGRTPSDIQKVFKAKIKDEELRKSVMQEIFRRTAEKPKNTSLSIAELNNYNSIRLNAKYAKESIVRVPKLILILGIITWILSSEKLNQNAVFAYSTLIQGAALFVLFYLMKKNNDIKMLTYALGFYFLIFAIELLFFGFPNDFFEAYNHVELNYRITHKIGPGVGYGIGRTLGFLAPFVYLSIKILFGLLIFRTYLFVQKYIKVPFDIQNQLG